MKIDYKHFLCFLFVFMIFQYIFLISEWYSYLDIISYIQGYKTNMYKNNKNQFTFRWIFVIIFGYIFMLGFLYYYMILLKKSLLESFIFISILYAFWDVCYIISFNLQFTQLPVLMYDILVVGGICMVISQYILYNYYNIIKNYIAVLFILYLLTMVLFFYYGYTYNPDLSNIKGLALL